MANYNGKMYSFRGNKVEYLADDEQAKALPEVAMGISGFVTAQ